MFIQTLWENPLLYVAVVVTVMVSIIVHELAHGWMALALGDDTPRASGHMTLDPLVHMGWMSLGFLFLAGISWGMMPINPHRLRGRHAQALVAVAGPLANVVLALIGLTVLAFIDRDGLGIGGFSGRPGAFAANWRAFLWVFGLTNVGLCLFNLLPLPPLDGSRILATYHRGYDRFIADPDHGGVLFVAFALAFFVSDILFKWAAQASGWYLDLLWRWT